MSVSEQQRHHFYTVAESVFGAEGAATLMEYLPPTGWSDVARKSDLDTLDARFAERMGAVDARFVAVDERFNRVDERFNTVDARMDALEHRMLSKIDALRTEFYKTQESNSRLIIFSMISAMFVVAALAFGAARLS